MACICTDVVEAYNYEQPLLWNTIIVHSIPTFIDLSRLGVLKDTISGFDVCIGYTQYNNFYIILCICDHPCVGKPTTLGSGSM